MSKLKFIFFNVMNSCFTFIRDIDFVCEPWLLVNLFKLGLTVKLTVAIPTHFWIFSCL